ncbi:MAG: hypothetical protein ACWGNK_04880, partial [Desulfobacterales bacterium]
KIDVVRVKGRAQCVDVFELVAENGHGVPPSHNEALKEYAAGYEAYCEQHWDEAIGLFEKALEFLPEDGPSRTMAERCRIYRETPPPEGWDCVYEPKTK